MAEQLVNGQPIDYGRLPASHRSTLKLYIESGVPPGSGTRAILEHDLAAVVMVDSYTFVQLRQIYRWLINSAPRECHGSAKIVSAWIAAKTSGRAKPFKRGE